jgi:hypothetical protein
VRCSCVDRVCTCEERTCCPWLSWRVCMMSSHVRMNRCAGDHSSSGRHITVGGAYPAMPRPVTRFRRVQVSYLFAWVKPPSPQLPRQGCAPAYVVRLIGWCSPATPRLSSLSSATSLLRRGSMLPRVCPVVSYVTLQFLLGRCVALHCVVAGQLTHSHPRRALFIECTTHCTGK